jgi:hypothetical protein
VLLFVIVACEVGFWLVLTAGLAARYVLRRPRLGAALLACVPLVDLVLLGATVLDLRAGATAGHAHGLAAVYLGFSVAFGHSMVRWADQRFAHRFGGGPPPWRPPRGGSAQGRGVSASEPRRPGRFGSARVRYEWREWGKAVLAWAIACGLLGLAVLLVGDADRTRALVGWVGPLTMAVVIWFVAFPLWVTLFPRRG